MFNINLKHYDLTPIYVRPYPLYARMKINLSTQDYLRNPEISKKFILIDKDDKKIVVGTGLFHKKKKIYFHLNFKNIIVQKKKKKTFPIILLLLLIVAFKTMMKDN